MTTVGTITFHQSINYGAVLQTYALQKTLTDMGHISEIIDYCPPQIGVNALPRFYRLRHYIWHFIFKKMIVGNERQLKMNDFRQRHLRLSTSSYIDLKTLHSNPPLYDAYITGSDQVWNPRNNNEDSSYFLSFAPPGTIRISYAASFGVSQIQPEIVSNYRMWLSQIHSISTREIEGKDIIKQLTGRDVEIVLDPTLLLDENHWHRIATPFESPRPYILCYYMPGDKQVNNCITQVAQMVSTFTGWGVVRIGQREYMRLHPRIHSIFDAGPSEFLGLVQNASFIVTNSFHGTAFSINYKKPFFVPINKSLSARKALSSRITTLLKTLKLEHRILTAGQKTSLKGILDLNFNQAVRILQKEKLKSNNFLKRALRPIKPCR